MPRGYTIGGGLALIVVILLGFHFLRRPAPVVAVAPQISHVHLSSVASLSSVTGPLPVTGKVTSLNDATILAQSAGEVLSLSHALGDRVGAGATIAQLDASSQSAAVQQARGAYDAAQAALAKASGSTAQNSSITSSQASQSAVNAQAAVIVSLQSAYSAIDDAVHTKADTLFSSAHTFNPQLLLSVSDSQLVIDLQNERAQLDALIANDKTLLSVVSDSNVDASVSQMIGDAQTVSAFLNNLIQAANQAQPNQNVSATAIAAYQASLATARSEVVTAISGMTTARTSYDSAQTGAQSAANSASGGTSNDIASAQANVQSALGALNAAKANLAKTVIRSPISGIIVNLSITRGDYVSSFAQVAEVSNPNALEVDAYVTPDDAKTIAVGGSAVIDGGTPGFIVSIAPALDPSTSKILVKVGISGDQSALTDGDTVAVSLSRATSSKNSKTNTAAAIVIPIAAAKITPAGPIVFTVDQGVLVSNPVVFGTILGDQVAVVSGITPEMDIVTDARGLSAGQSIVVDATN